MAFHLEQSEPLTDWFLPAEAVTDCEFEDEMRQTCHENSGEPDQPYSVLGFVEVAEKTLLEEVVA